MESSKSHVTTPKRRNGKHRTEQLRNGTGPLSDKSKATRRIQVPGSSLRVIALLSLLAIAPVIGYVLAMNSFWSVKTGLASTLDKKRSTGLTSEADHLILDQLEEAEGVLDRGRLKDAMHRFSALLVSYPKSPRAMWGYARSLDAFSKGNRHSNFYKEAMRTMHELLALPEVPRGLTHVVMSRLVDHYIFKEPPNSLDRLWSFLSRNRADGNVAKRLFAIELIRYQQTYGRAERVLKRLLDDNPEDCISMATMGRLYIKQNKSLETAAELLQKAVDLNCEGVRNSMIYNHLSDSYIRLGEKDKAHALHNQAVSNGVFFSAYQRSSNNADSPLAARPWWTYEQTTYEKDLKLLESNWKEIRDEALSILKTDRKGFLDDKEKLIDEGLWQKLLLYQNGRRYHQNCERAPKTCQLLSKIPDSTTLTRGQVKFSVLTPGTHLWAHCGPTNCRIRAHLGLVVPEGPILRVCNETRTWIEGKFVIFDDSFEHEVWHDGKVGDRLVLIVDFWHPDITMEQRKRLRPYN